MRGVRPSKAESRSPLPEGLDRGELRKGLLGFAQQGLFVVGCGAHLVGVNREAIGDQRGARGEIVETA